MSDKASFEDTAIIARVREHLRRSLPDASLPLAPRPDLRPDSSPAVLEQELATLRAAADICDVRTRVYRGVLGPVFAIARRIARKLLAPSLEQQVTYNAANQRLVEALRAEIDALKAQQQTLRQQCDLLAAKLEAARTQR